MKYQDHKNRNHWNVSLYLDNEYELYLLVQTTLKLKTTKHVMTHFILSGLIQRGFAHTPDGVRYTYAAVRAHLVGATVDNPVRGL